MIAYWNSDLRCEFANKAYLHWFGRPGANVVGLTLPQLLGPDLFRANEPYVRGALRGEAQSFERTLTKANGDIGYTWAQYLPDVVDGVTRGFLAIVSDITEVKRAEAALRSSEARLQQILDASPVPYALNDDRMRMTYVNPAFVRAFGYTLEEVPTLDQWWPAAYPDPEYRRSVMSVWEHRYDRARLTGRQPEPMEVLLRCKDGTTKTVMAYSALLHGDSGETYVDVLLDVSELRRLEQRMLEQSGREQHQLGIAMHEGLSQDLAALSLLLDGLGTPQASDEITVSRHELRRLAELARRCVATSRSFAHGLSPIELGNRGLADALQQLATAARRPGGPELSVHLAGLERVAMEPGFAETVYRIVQSVWNAAVSRAGVTRIALDARVARDRLRITVIDDGARADVPSPEEQAAVDSIRYRARALGGVLDLEHGPAGSNIVRLTCSLPSR